MSLLREAERFLVNQQKSTLNAFITPLPRAGAWLDRVMEAEQRRKEGAEREAACS